MAPDDSSETQAPILPSDRSQVQQVKRLVRSNSRQHKSVEEASIRYSPTFLLVLFGIQRVACVAVAVWDYFHTRDLTRFTMLLLASQIDLSKAKDLLTKVITEVLTKYIAKEIE